MKLRPGLTKRHSFTMPSYFGTGAFTQDISSDTLPAPANDAANDICLACVHTDANDTFTATGYAHVTGSPLAFGSSQLHVLWKRAVDGNNNVTITTTDGWQGFLAVVRGVKQSGNPWTNLASDTQSSATSIVIPGLNVTENNTLVVIILAHEIAALVPPAPQASSGANADLANFTERADDGDAVGPDGGLVIFSGEKAVDGTIGNTTCTLAAASATGRFILTFNGG